MRYTIKNRKELRYHNSDTHFYIYHVTNFYLNSYEYISLSTLENLFIR